MDPRRRSRRASLHEQGSNESLQRLQGSLYEAQIFILIFYIRPMNVRANEDDILTPIRPASAISPAIRRVACQIEEH